MEGRSDLLSSPHGNFPWHLIYIFQEMKTFIRMSVYLNYIYNLEIIYRAYMNCFTILLSNSKSPKCQQSPALHSHKAVTGVVPFPKVLTYAFKVYICVL